MVDEVGDFGGSDAIVGRSDAIVNFLWVTHPFDKLLPGSVRSATDTRRSAAESRRRTRPCLAGLGTAIRQLRPLASLSATLRLVPSTGIACRAAFAREQSNASAPYPILQPQAEVWPFLRTAAGFCMPRRDDAQRDIMAASHFQ
jgi:hypothetical protein